MECMLLEGAIEKQDQLEFIFFRDHWLEVRGELEQDLEGR